MLRVGWPTAEPVKAPVEVPGGSCVLHLRRPTYGDRTRHDGLRGQADGAAYYKFLADHVVGWDGVCKDDGAELPFAPKTLESAYAASPALYAAAVDAAFALYRPADEPAGADAGAEPDPKAPPAASAPA